MHGTAIAIVVVNGKRLARQKGWEQNMNALAHLQMPVAHIGKLATGICASPRGCVIRMLFWAGVNFGTIAPVMT